jgi:tricorn protease interacting factor F2/3
VVELTPAHYNILVEPDLSQFTFKGETEIYISASEPISEFSLNGLDLEIMNCSVYSNGSVQKTEWQIDLENQLINLNFNEKIKDFTVKIEYIGEINDYLVGFYRSRYQINGETRYAGVTQFEESDARRAFPCFDEPSKKATFLVSFIIDDNLTGISNSHIVEEIKLENNRKKIVFAKTPVMSTYLLFFGVGEFNKIEKKLRDYNVSVIASPAHTPLDKYGSFGLDFAVKSLDFCEDYFAIDFPFQKLDNIATADFAHGAMENYGAILYRENLLLYFPGITDQQSETRIQEVVAHEITHQWFGNLVSPLNWKYLWLNESFATFFGFGIIDHYYPEKKIWELFVQRMTEPALNSDAYIETLPIERPGEGAVGMTVKNANILYNKGGSVLRQMKHYIGDETFRDGLRQFLKKYAYSNARSDDLWKAFEDVSGKPITSLMESWVLQDGYPLITIAEDKGKLKLSQKRFTFLPQDSASKWIVPISIKLFFSSKEPEEIYYLMENEELSIEIPEEVKGYIINSELKGFYRVMYPGSRLNSLTEMVQNNTLSPIDKWGVENDLFALLRARKITLDMYLEFISNYVGETTQLSIQSISEHLHTIYTLANGENEIKIAHHGKQFIEKSLEIIGLEPKSDEDPLISTLRGNLLFNAVIFGSAIVQDFAMDKFELFKNGEGVSPDILLPVLQIAARVTDDIDWFVNYYEETENEQLSINLLRAMGNFTNPSHIEKMQAFTFEKVPSRNSTYLVGSISNNPIAKDTLWHWYLANLDNFEKMHEYMYQISILAIVRQSSAYHNDVKNFFNGYVEKNPKVSDAVDMALESLDIRKRFIAHINQN